MRVAVIADTHGNLVALDAVLAEIDREGVDRIVCLGDVAGLGSEPHETVQRLRSLGCPVVLGNADEFLIDPVLLDPAHNPDLDDFTRMLHDMERWTIRQLTTEDLDFIRSFQPIVDLDLGDGLSMLCYHGTPKSAWEEIRGSTPDDEMAEKLGELRPIMTGGHTHDQFFRRLHSTIVFNPGSVGLPYEVLADGRARNPPWAEYAIVSHDQGAIRLDLRRVPTDIAEIRRRLLVSDMPHKDVWAADWW